MVAILAGCNRQKSTHHSKITIPPRNVTVATVLKGDVRKIFAVTGTAFALTDVAINSKIAGKIEHVMVDEGEEVTSGQVLIRLEQTDLLIAESEAKARVAMASATLSRMLAGTRKEKIEMAKAQAEQAKANLDQAKRDLDRAEALYSEHTIPKEKLDVARTTYASATAAYDTAKAQYEMALAGERAEDIAAARAQLTQANARLKSVQAQLQDTLIRAPFSGVVVKKMHDQGETVSPGIPLLRLVDMSIIKVNFFLPDNLYARIKTGQEITLRFDAFPQRTFTEKVTTIVPYIEPASLKFKMQVEMKNTDVQHRIAPGMFAHASLVLEERRNVLSVPNRAIVKRETDGATIVFLAENGLAKEQVVKTGIAGAGRTEILAGLKKGQHFIVEGLFSLSNGTPISVKESIK